MLVDVSREGSMNFIKFYGEPFVAEWRVVCYQQERVRLAMRG